MSESYERLKVLHEQLYAGIGELAVHEPTLKSYATAVKSNGNRRIRLPELQEDGLRFTAYVRRGEPANAEIRWAGTTDDFSVLDVEQHYHMNLYMPNEQPRRVLAVNPRVLELDQEYDKVVDGIVIPRIETTLALIAVTTAA